ncbi:MAG: hypothetical protein R2828_02430 [Saprospiraceae bacterium]
MKSSKTIRSKFSFWILPLLAYVAFFSWLIVVIIVGIKGSLDVPGPVYLFLFFYMWMWILLFWGELRAKAIVVRIYDDAVTKSPFWGLIPRRRFSFDELRGYTTEQRSTRIGTFKYLYIYKGDKRVIKLSSLYHRNFKVLKGCIMKKLPALGSETYTVKKALKEFLD